MRRTVLMRALVGAWAFGIAAAPVAARADAEAVWVVERGIDGTDDAVQGRPWRAMASDWLRASGAVEVTDLPAWILALLPEGGVMPERVAVLREVEQLLVDARAKSAALQEADALRLFVRAQALMRSHADVPGAAGWLAEIEASLAVTAAQVGLDELAAASLDRAATLDPDRGALRPAEAPPDLVARAQAIAASAAARPSGEVVVDVASGPPARVFLDDALVGSTPTLIRASIGCHVVRLDAPGMLPYGAVIDLLEGSRASMRVALAPDPLATAAENLARAVHDLNAEQIAAGIARLRALGAPLMQAWVVMHAARGVDRVAVFACQERGCGVASVFDCLGDLPLLPTGEVVSPELFAQGLTDTRARLSDARVIDCEPHPGNGWQHWYVWAGAAAGAAIGVGAALLLATPEPETRLRVVVTK